MDDSQDKKDTLKVSRPNTLSLTKTVEGGKVKQNFQRGRSKTVTVEVKKTRNFARGAEGMVEVKRDNPAAQGGRYLTAGEREARLKALQNAETAAPASRQTVVHDHEAAAARAAETQPQTGPRKATVMDDRAAKNLETLRNAQPRSDAAAAAAKRPAGVGAAPARKDESDEERAKLEAKKTGKIRLKDEEYRRSSAKMTLNQAMGDGDERQRSLASVKRARAKLKRGGESANQEKVFREVTIPDVITVQELANRMTERGVDVIKELMKLGQMATLQQSVDADTAELLVVAFGHKPKRVSESDVEERMTVSEDAAGDLKTRPPVVTIMGHVDHGKTSLLDSLRKTNVVSGEAGGITQHIGAYQITLEDGQKVTFLDTPGHEAFTAMRARGAKVTDIVILVVAADDGIMPQTEEAISHARAAQVPIIVAINKIDKPDADPSKVKQMLMNYELVPEDFGGDIMTVEVSAKQNLNLDKLLEAVLLQAEILELKANPDREASGTVIEAKVDKGRGTVATLLLQRGTLKKGDIVVAGSSYGRVRAIFNDLGQEVLEALPSQPIEILGLNEPPYAGDEFGVVDSEKSAREVTEYRASKEKKAQVVSSAKSLDQLFASAAADAPKELPLIIKSDVHGSMEAIVGSMGKFADQEVKVKVIHSGVGAISESDVVLAQTTGAMIVAFNVRATGKAKELADKGDVNIRYYSVIYDVVDDVKAALSGLLSPEKRENFLGYAEIRDVFNITKVGKVAGCMVTEGLMRRAAKVRLLRDNVVIHEGTLKTLKRFKDEVKEVKSGFECGMAFENYDDIKVGDFIEAFEVQELAREVGMKAVEKDKQSA